MQIPLHPIRGNNESPRARVKGQPTAGSVDFACQLYTGLSAAGYGNVWAVFQGSSVTGQRFKTGLPFDVGRTSDYDIGLASPSLLDRARAAGIQVRSGGLRTAPLAGEDLDRLGLRAVADQLSQLVGRPVNFMVFDCPQTAITRGPSVVAPRP